MNNGQMNEYGKMNKESVQGRKALRPKPPSHFGSRSSFAPARCSLKACNSKALIETVLDKPTNKQSITI